MSSSASLLIPSGPTNDPDRKHLFVCLTDVHGVNKETLIVSVSTHKAGFPADDACKLFPGDHSFTKHQSYVDYAKARIVAASKLMNGVKSGTLIAKEPLDTGVFARVCHGFEQSAFTAPLILDFYKKALGT